MKLPFTGGCMCGAIRYECSAEPIMMGNCHCRDCQQATGTAFAAAMLVLRDAVSITRMQPTELIAISPQDCDSFPRI